ncbi:MAG: putative metal-binding motif-containing protein, partial [Deltaproteobacteria bacterium]|nr:putative metal-binding motif-containing protein [Deltaproteobacteria bacterium]
PSGFADLDDDCDDENAATFPGAAEICDGEDNDCDGLLSTDEVDDDGDGVTECDGDCDDVDPVNFAGNTEVCDGLDNDCDGLLGAIEIDDDGDGLTECDGDCDDTNAGVLPGATEVCDGADSDCDGNLGTDEIDDDGDGITECDGDCDDVDAGTFPGNAEVCDGVDDNCDPSDVCHGVSVNGTTQPIEPFTGTTQDVTTWYQYGAPNGASANTGLEISDSAVVFLFDDATDGEVYLVVILDAANDGAGGSATGNFNGIFGASMILKDDPNEGTTTIDPVAGTGLVTWNWVSCCTDGGVIGPLNPGFMVDVQFSVANGFNSVTTYDGSLAVPLGLPSDTHTFIEIFE